MIDAAGKASVWGRQSVPSLPGWSIEDVHGYLVLRNDLVSRPTHPLPRGGAESIGTELLFSPTN